MIAPELVVIAGLDPAIHPLKKKCSLNFGKEEMDHPNSDLFEFGNLSA
jgi:hypothetical protein